MTYEEIHKSLKGQGFTWAAASEAIGCTPVHLMNICARRAEGIRVAKSVSLLIDVEVSEAFPDKPRYNEDKEKKVAESILKAKEKLKAAGLEAA